MYLEAIALTRTQPCLAERGKIVVVGRPSRALHKILPYLATLPGVIAYNPELPARPLDVYALLPQRNCGQCGEATCMAFAFALLQQRRRLAECLPLQQEAAWIEQREALAALC